MRARGIRAWSLLLAAAIFLALSPAHSAQTNAWVLDVRLAEGSSSFTNPALAGSYGAVSVSITQGMTGEWSSANAARFGGGMMSDYWGCITVSTPTKYDYGCAVINMSKAMIDPAMSMAVLNFSVPSYGRPGKKLHATNVMIRVTGDPLPSFDLADVQLQPPPPQTRAIRYTGPMLRRDRNGTVTGTIVSEYAGGGELKPYTGPPAGDSIALLSESIIHTAFGDVCTMPAGATCG